MPSTRAGGAWLCRLGVCDDGGTVNCDEISSRMDAMPNDLLAASPPFFSILLLGGFFLLLQKLGFIESKKHRKQDGYLDFGDDDCDDDDDGDGGDGGDGGD